MSVFETPQTPLDFIPHSAIPAFIDKKQGLEIETGRIAGLPPNFSGLKKFEDTHALSFMDKGMGQDELDTACQLLNETARQKGLELLITKSDTPHDLRWYWAGDLQALFDHAKTDQLQIPLSLVIFEEILEYLGKLES